LESRPISQNLTSQLTEIPEDLLAYYNFNQGTADADNSELELLYDATENGYNGKLIDMELNGTASNFINAECTNY